LPQSKAAPTKPKRPATPRNPGETKEAPLAALVAEAELALPLDDAVGLALSHLQSEHDKLIKIDSAPSLNGTGGRARGFSHVGVEATKQSS
jgi:hypothetical protein